MALSLGPDYWQKELRYEQIVLERFRYHAKTMGLLAIAPMLMNSTEIVRHLDMYSRDFALSLVADLVKGDVTTEQKTIEHTGHYQVFENWTDHLKYRIVSGRIPWLQWLPKWLTSRLSVRYRQEAHKWTDSVPVTLIRVCPHADFKWEREEMQKHFAFLRPEMFRDESARAEKE